MTATGGIPVYSGCAMASGSSEAMLLPSAEPLRVDQVERRDAEHHSQRREHATGLARLLHRKSEQREVHRVTGDARPERAGSPGVYLVAARQDRSAAERLAHAKCTNQRAVPM